MSDALPRKPRRGDTLQVEWTALDDRGGTQRVRGKASHVTGEYDCSARFGVPGSRVEGQVLRRRAHVLDIFPLATLDPSPHAVVPACAHFGRCGGCAHQDTLYAVQLEQKRDFVRRALLSAGLADAAELVEPVLACDPPWRYRNKMDFSFSARRWIDAGEPPDAPRDFALGLHPANRFDRVIDLDDCSITFEEARTIVAAARDLARSMRLPPWDVVRHEGLLRHLVLRRSASSGEILVALVTSREEAASIDAFAAALRARASAISTFVQHIHDRPGQTAQGGVERVLFGSGYIEERLRGRSFRLSAHSFFQTNSAQAEVLARLVLDQACSANTRSAWDLYCGAGLWAILLADRFERVSGVELVASAARDAVHNAECNGVRNALFVAADVERWAKEQADAPDLLIVDPPRAGLGATALELLGRCFARGTQRAIYVSCNPRSAARDLASMRGQGFALSRVQPIDMFPHTPHVECVFTLDATAPDR